MIATLLILLALLSGSPAPAAVETVTHYVFLPIVARPEPCQPITGVSYANLDVEGPPSFLPADQHPDLNLTMRGYEPTTAYGGLVNYGGGFDPNAPQLYTLFDDGRVPAFTTLYQVYDWDWDCHCRGGLLDTWAVTLAGMGVVPGEVLHLPDSGYDIGGGFDALVLYATEDQITLKYTPEDHVVYGYTIHLENICVEPSLLARYQRRNAAGRDRLPALRGGQPFGRARGDEIGVAIRDTGSFMDPRSRKDWWQGR